MNRLHACVILAPERETPGKREKRAKNDVTRAGNAETPGRPAEKSEIEGTKSKIEALARRFSGRIEMIEGGVLFDVSGLENRIGPPPRVASEIWRAMRDEDLAGDLAVASNARTAILYARSRPGVTVIEDGIHQPLPLAALGIDNDALNVFRALGIESSDDLQRLPESGLIARYGNEFRDVIDLVNHAGVHILTPNLKENYVSWDYRLDFAVEDFERLIFILGHGLGKVLEETAHAGSSTEQIDIMLSLEDGTAAEYEVKVSFPTLEKSFWLKVINLRFAAEPPAAAIVGIGLTCRFVRSRSVQRGLYSPARPEPESLLLTVGKIKNLVGSENVGVPILIDQRLPEAFELDAAQLPTGRELKTPDEPEPRLAFTYFHPPLEASIGLSDGRLVHLRTKHFAGRVIEYGGTWIGSSQWWTPGHWQRMEWEVELEDKRVYRLMFTGEEWFVVGVFD